MLFRSGNSATNANNSNFLGRNAGSGSINASNSNFLGQNAGSGAPSASYSNLFGYQAGYNPNLLATGIGSNNIIIGTNITLPDSTKDSINLGAIIFATGSYSTPTGNPFSGPTTNGRVGINKVTPTYTLDVSGSGNYTNGLTVTGSVSLSSVLTLAPQHPLPASPVVGTLAISASIPPRPYFWDGTIWYAL